MVGKELWYISQAQNNKQLSGDGQFIKKCHEKNQEIGRAHV